MHNFAVKNVSNNYRLKEKYKFKLLKDNSNLPSSAIFNKDSTFSTGFSLSLT